MDTYGLLSRHSLQFIRYSTESTVATMLPALPRFHPATFSYHNENAYRISITPNGYLPPVLPQLYQKQIQEVLEQMNPYQQGLIGGAVGRNEKRMAEPTTPCLFPVASPGPVTPLELESVESYFITGMDTNSAGSSGDKFIQVERRGSPPL